VPLFTYKAIDPRGKSVMGRVEAVNLFDLEQRLARMDLDLVSGAEVVHESDGVELPFPKELLSDDNLSLYVRIDGTPSLNGASVVGGGDIKLYNTVDAVLYWSGEKFAAREVAFAVTVDKGAVFD